ncbi:MAG: ribonucleotide-diphosphate reductase subunit beta, partial [Rhodospirillales bacterium]|nr:ribonucleotide-diphosphate reductase subunit beta [Rhodospirillales bacterium]
MSDTPPVRFDLLTANPVYKPFRYPWAYDAWLMQQRIHWLPEEVPLADDVKDWQKSLTEGERNLLTQIFRFFTQADVEVNNCYMKQYSQVFKPTEVLMMMSAFSNTETIHIAAYSHLLDTIGMPESEYTAFLKYKEMKDKYDYMQNFSVENKTEIAKTLAAFGAFTEGLQLFASFAILMNFPRFNKMKGMGQIISWSVRDETLHCLSVIRLFRTFVQENPEIWTEDFKRDLYLICATIVDHEDAFIDLAFELG